MKFFTAAAVLSAAVSEVSGHYIFQQLSVGSTKYDVFQHIRKNTNYNSPVTDLASNDLRCNVGGASGAQTTVVNVKPGDAFTFTLDTAVYHQGPISLFLSKAPSHVQDYDGSGKWAKFKDFLPTFSNGQATWPMRQTYEYKIPTCLPNGEYLLRVHQLGIHNPYPAGIPQFYISCAQINVTGSTASASSFAPTLSIPGAFKDTDPGYTVNIYQPGFTSYVAPGGAEASGSNMALDRWRLQLGIPTGPRVACVGSRYILDSGPLDLDHVSVAAPAIVRGRVASTVAILSIGRAVAAAALLSFRIRACISSLPCSPTSWQARSLTYRLDCTLAGLKAGLFSVAAFPGGVGAISNFVWCFERTSPVHRDASALDCGRARDGHRYARILQQRRAGGEKEPRVPGDIGPLVGLLVYSQARPARAPANEASETEPILNVKRPVNVAACCAVR
ncbi:fungal cellulose binding domain-containing protein [Colletotrichum fioriniae PJ7]|uniref:lytic cellulose monooxygenase (C4-dehydrogenating) n=1 Tax=Colletotrichum fioriniae PJ7 TaxID=1445577 RepID=A0A010RUP2_9PEZI|nr:fungal cellulose binding domain-containing protein [Colletotrichum fioriniae PJ7]